MSMSRYALLLLALLGIASAAHNFVGHRVAQFDGANVPFGSRRTTMNHALTSVDWAATSTAAAPSAFDLNRKVAAVKIEDLTVERLQELTGARRASGLLIILPHHVEDPSKYRALEQWMLTHEMQLPVYFAFDDSELQNIMRQLDAELQGVDSGTRYHVATSGTEAADVSTPTSTNMHGWLHGKSRDAALPTIAVVASYDTFATSPTLAFGVSHSATGLVAVLELSRVFAKLYAHSQPHYNMLFVIVGGGRLLGSGLKHWLNTVDQRVVESLDFALCLESLAGESLHLHVHRAPKKPEIAQLYANFETSAAQLNVHLDVVPKKGNMTAENYEWPHERFSRKKVLAATLSSELYPSNEFIANATIFEPRVSAEALSRNIRLVAEALGRHVYATQAPLLAAGSHAINQNFVSSWLKFLGAQARVDAFLGKKAPVLSELEKTLSKHTTDFARSTFALASDVRFYRAAQEPHSLSIFSVKPVMFDMYLSLAVIAYTFVILALAKGVSSVSDLKDLFVIAAKKK